MGPDGLEPARLRRTDFAYEAEVSAGRLLFTGAKGETISAAEADGGGSGGADGGHEGFVYDSGENHDRDVSGFSVGDAQAVDKIALFAEQTESAGKCSTAAVDHGDAMSVAGELHDGVGALVQHWLVFESCASNFDDQFHCNPCSSFQPHMRFMFWTACPAAPLSRLSTQETRTRRRPSSARQKPRSQ